MTQYEYYQKRKPFKTIDVIIIVVGLIFCVCGFFLLLPKPGNTVEITVQGVHYASYPLSQNKTIVMSEIEIIIENGTVKVANSSCSNKLCQRQGTISMAHQCIVCAPNRILISISGNAKYDTIVGGA